MEISSTSYLGFEEASSSVMAWHCSPPGERLHPLGPNRSFEAVRYFYAAGSVGTSGTYVPVWTFVLLDLLLVVLCDLLGGVDTALALLVSCLHEASQGQLCFMIFGYKRTV